MGRVDGVKWREKKEKGSRSPRVRLYLVGLDHYCYHYHLLLLSTQGFHAGVSRKPPCSRIRKKTKYCVPLLINTIINSEKERERESECDCVCVRARVGISFIEFYKLFTLVFSCSSMAERVRLKEKKEETEIF